VIKTAIFLFAEKRKHKEKKGKHIFKEYIISVCPNCISKIILQNFKIKSLKFKSNFHHYHFFFLKNFVF